VDPEQERAFLKYVKMAFAQPRKQLKNVIAGIRGVTNADIAAEFAKLGIADNARAQELTEAQWLALWKGNI
jgi:16S rRNA A1518/A1519 N6-dimethyltransferase RsmA/KsgA/DIM1 with predicted DNA glycosylase/AP lyase activity